MKRLRKINEAEVIAEFLKNEFYQDDFHYDREKYEKIVLEPNLDDDLENAVRRALLFRRRGHMWRELPADTEWWLVQLETQDVAGIRVFPRAQWRKIASGSYDLDDIAKRIRSTKFNNGVREFVSKIQSLSYRLRRESDDSAILLIGIDESRPFTILEGNHRLVAALLVSPDVLVSRFRVLCGFSTRMQESCWYDTNLNTLWRYLKHRLRNVVDKEADIERALSTGAARSGGEVRAAGKQVVTAKPELRASDAVR
jgi:hypothetical protein